MKNGGLTKAQVADILGVSKGRLSQWEEKGELVPSMGNGSLYSLEQLSHFKASQSLISSQWESELEVAPRRDFKVIELFAGAGGLALGMERAGFKSVLLSELDKYACDTLKHNRLDWNVVSGDVTKLDFKSFRGEVDVLSGGFPCQAFSYAGNGLGFEDSRGTLFYQFARVAEEVAPKVIVAENVRGLLTHDKGKTIATIKAAIDELGYDLVCPNILKAIFFQVPQKRERLFLIGIRKDLSHLAKFKWPSPYHRIMTMEDALKAGDLYETDVPKSDGQSYPASKKEVFDLVPPGGYWKHLPLDVQKRYMKKSFYSSGGKTGIARRLSWDEPSLTLMCSPSQNQTERCHPDETRPLTVREYARIQTFPDDWFFSGPLSSQYRQIGNAVPVNLAYAVGRSVMRLLNEIDAAERRNF